MGKIEAQTVKGFRDLMPAQARRKSEIISKIKAAYEQFGFQPVETPALEYLDILLDEYGEENTRQIFKLKSPENQDVALRFDLTVPLARLVAQYNDLPRPFKRYQVASVWRADKPDPGRFREFTQFDVDIVGTSSQLAEAEVISAVVNALTSIDIGEFEVKVNSRRVLNAVVNYAGIPDELGKNVFRVLDKLNKIGMENVKLELTRGRYDVSGDFIPGLGLDSGSVAKIEDYLMLPKGDRKIVTKELSSLLGDQSAVELIKLDEFLSVLGLKSEIVSYDPTIARGLDYYTGPVFEVVLKDKAQFGSIAGGGRYDGLVKRFTEVEIPAVGFSIGVDRLLAAIESKLPAESPVDIVVTVMDRNKLSDYLSIANDLRKSGKLIVDLYVGDEKSLRKQLQYADRVGAKIAVIVGPDEFQRGTVTIKDLRKGKSESKDISDREKWLKKTREIQVEIPRSEMTSALITILSSVG
ncbi:MAG: histidine--tRNA ligase [Candidatus Kryptoniota bacterium]